MSSSHAQRAPHADNLSAAKDCPERSRTDLMPLASGDEILRGAQDDSRAIAYGYFRRLDRSAKRGAERPSLNDKPLIVERRTLRSAWSLPRAKSRAAPVETTEIAMCDSARDDSDVETRSRPFPPIVILSAAKDLMPVASGDEIPSAPLRAGLRCARDDRDGSHDACHPQNCHPERSEGPLPVALKVPRFSADQIRATRDDNDVAARSGPACHADRGPPGPLMLMRRAGRPAIQ